MIDVNKLHYLFTAAESGSFREAARTLQVRQSSVSRGISRLEDQLGVSLFERSRGGVRLTDAGERFLADARTALDQLEIAQKMALAAGRAEIGIVRVGILTSLAGGFLRELMSCYAHHHPEVAIDIHDGGRDDHLAAIQQHRLDIAFLTGAGKVLRCEVAELWRERVYVALMKEHPLARRRKLDWPDLHGEHFIVTRIAPGPEVHDYITRRIADYSTYPKIAIKDVNRETLLNLVSLGQGITLVSAAWSHVKFPGLVLRPLTREEDMVPFSAVWSAQNDNPALRRLVSAAHVLAGRVRCGASDWSRELIGIPPFSKPITNTIGAVAASSATGRMRDRSP